MSAVPNDRRTRQLYIDAAIKRALTRSREARHLADGDSDEPGGPAARPGIVHFGAVTPPRQRDSAPPVSSG
jgi:hypothetical protein